MSLYSHKVYYNFSKKQLNIINELVWHSTRFYNIVQHDMLTNGHRHNYKNERIYKNHWRWKFFNPNFQQMLRVLEQNWKAYFATSSDYKLHPQKYTGEPKRPGYKNMSNNRNELIFIEGTILGKRSKNGGNVLKNNTLRLTLSKVMKKKYNVQFLGFDMTNIKMPERFDYDNIHQIRIAYDRRLRKYYLNFIYECNDVNLNLGDNIMSIDLGLNNLETITFDNNRDTFIIDGKVLKSKQAYINKQIGICQSKEMIRLGSSTKYKDTKRIRNYRKKYNAFCNNYIHKYSKMTIDLAIKNNCGTIVIGDFSGIKQNNHAKLFVKIPHLKLRQQIEYKAAALGIDVIKVNEAYTSGCSVLDNEPIDALHYNKSRRITRGMFKSNNGTLINADVNGSYNIMRKYINRVPNCLVHLVALNMLQTSVLMGNSGTVIVPHYLDYQPKRLRVL